MKRRYHIYCLVKLVLGPLKVGNNFETCVTELVFCFSFCAVIYCGLLYFNFTHSLF